jgi:hypothetical protein
MASGDINCQARKLDADGYAAYKLRKCGAAKTDRFPRTGLCQRDFRNYFARAAQLFCEPIRQIWDAQRS